MKNTKVKLNDEIKQRIMDELNEEKIEELGEYLLSVMEKQQFRTRKFYISRITTELILQGISKISYEAENKWVYETLLEACYQDVQDLKWVLIRKILLQGNIPFLGEQAYSINLIEAVKIYHSEFCDIEPYIDKLLLETYLKECFTGFEPKKNSGSLKLPTPRMVYDGFCEEILLKLVKNKGLETLYEKISDIFREVNGNDMSDLLMDICRQVKFKAFLLYKIFEFGILELEEEYSPEFEQKKVGVSGWLSLYASERKCYFKYRESRERYYFALIAILFILKTTVYEEGVALSFELDVLEIEFLLEVYCETVNISDSQYSEILFVIKQCQEICLHKESDIMPEEELDLKIEKQFKLLESRIKSKSFQLTKIHSKRFFELEQSLQKIENAETIISRDKVIFTEIFSKIAAIKEVRLFGSFVTGEAKYSSDYDLAIILEPYETLANARKVITTIIAEELGRISRPVDYWVYSDLLIKMADSGVSGPLESSKNYKILYIKK